LRTSSAEQPDHLALFSAEGRLPVLCQGVPTVRIINWKPGDPVPIALLLPSLDKGDLVSGDLVVADEQGAHASAGTHYERHPGALPPVE